LENLNKNRKLDQEKQIHSTQKTRALSKPKIEGSCTDYYISIRRPTPEELNIKDREVGQMVLREDYGWRIHTSHKVLLQKRISVLFAERIKTENERPNR
jgi:hypothetical protein